MKSAGRIFVESAEAWQRLVAALRQPPHNGTLRIDIPGEEEQIIFEILSEQQVICFSFEPRRKRRGVALPVADRSSSSGEV